MRAAFMSALVAAGCGDSNGDDTTTTTTSPGTTSTGPTEAGTTGSEPTTGGTTGPDATSGTTGPGPTTGPEPTTGEPVDPAVYEQCKANQADEAMITVAQCECDVAEGGFPDMAACLAAYGTSAEVVECTCTIYGENPESKAGLECIAGPQKTYVACFAGSKCGDFDAQLVCIMEYINATNGCPEPPKVVSNAVLIECLGEPAFGCGSGEQVPEGAKCNFQLDCMDGSDELGCENAFMCMNGSSIPIDFKCDGSLDCCEGQPDCRDMSDEAGCPVFMCMDGETIPAKFKCDGADDCKDGSDEKGCPVFMCGSGEEIPESFKCDDFPDCMDGSDEENCL